TWIRLPRVVVFLCGVAIVETDVHRRTEHDQDLAGDRLRALALSNTQVLVCHRRALVDLSREGRSAAFGNEVFDEGVSGLVRGDLEPLAALRGGHEIRLR